MEITNQYTRRRRNLSPDRLTDLPDAVLCHILSFLPTKFSVRTSILGQRWRYLWSFLPNLVFDCKEQHTAIDRVLLLHKLQKIDTFRLADGIECCGNQIEAWVTFAVDRNVQSLDFYCRPYDTALLRRIFTCKTLVDLRLDSCGVVPNIGGGVVCLPRLKKLCLINVHYEGDESLPHLLSGCPVLEELEIYLFIHSCHCKISSPTIKRLVINLRFDGKAFKYLENKNNRVEINTPALVYLRLVDCAVQYLKCGALTVLTEANIDIRNNRHPEDYVLYSRSVVEFIDKLHNVSCLKLNLSRCVITDTVFSTWKIKSFRNLTKLELIANSCFLPKILANADHLEILILYEAVEIIKGWTEPQQVPTCLLSHLRTVTLVHFEGRHMFKIMRYLLRNAKVLEMMEIVYPKIFDSKDKIYTHDEISRFERGSKACKLAFISKW
ncbi:hypothetical protein ABFS82_13G076400 [Erythranthe guttata]|nr:PREDICTED: F-box/LRR-repeat protein At4g14103-like [Erythranthe guttata]|eukprot:XP_012847597.1 PREDICTED: F-box/LRR-repeat protein At4g14103-like [Erythranthe guttata]